MSIYITTQATADFPKSFYKENFAIIPMGYTVNGVGYDGDKKVLTSKEFYEKVSQAKTKEDLPQTSLITAFQAEEFFRPILKAGHDIIHIGFDSSLSSTMQQLEIAQKTMQEEFPDRKITVIDSLSASYVEGMEVYYALKKRDEGASYEEICDYILWLRDHCFAFFVIDDLMHLVRTGRTAKAAGYIGSALHIKPILYINKLGKLVPIAKVMSQKKAYITMLDMSKEKMLPMDMQDQICIGHADNLPDAEFLAEKVKEEFGVKDVPIIEIGPFIGTHVGKGMVAIFFLADNKIMPNDPDFNLMKD